MNAILPIISQLHSPSFLIYRKDNNFHYHLGKIRNTLTFKTNKVSYNTKFSNYIKNNKKTFKILVNLDNILIKI